MSESQEAPRGMARTCQKTQGASVIWARPLDKFGTTGASKHIMLAMDYNLLSQVKNPRVHMDINKQMGKKRELAGSYSRKPINKCKREEHLGGPVS